MADISVRDVSKTYRASLKSDRSDADVRVLSSVSFSVPDGEFITFIGPNGCGKTTLLNIIAGLTTADTGTVKLGGCSPSESRLGFVFQNYAESLLPWKTVADNIAFPLELKGVARDARRQRVQELMEELDLDLPLDRFPYQLSGGQQQMVAIARALIHRPEVLLMDEPFNQLDYQTRLRMNDRVLDIWRSTKSTILFVSHELEEALLLGDRVFFLGGYPTTIVSDFQTEFPRERDHRIVATARFRSLLEEAIRTVTEQKACDDSY